MTRRAMKKPKIACIDGDILVYKTAYWAEANDPLGIEQKLEKELKKWLPKGIDESIIALSCKRTENFRREQWSNYKSNRDSMYAPEYLDEVRDLMLDKHEAEVLPNIEADDILGIRASSGECIAVTIDKDLRGVHGWHYNPDKEINPVLVSEDEAYRFFCRQWMSGDSTDCIPGLWRIGPKKADKFLDEWDKSEWEQRIIELYNTDKHKPRHDCGLGYPAVAIAMARCVKILSTKDYDLKTNEIKLWSPIDG